MLQNRKTEIRSKISNVFEPEEEFQCDVYEHNENKHCMTYIAATNKRIIVFHEISNNTRVKSKSFDMINNISYDERGNLLIELNDELIKLSEKSFSSDLDRLYSFLDLITTREKMKRDKIAQELKAYKKRKERKINGGRFILVAGITVIVTAAITLGVGFVFNQIDNLKQDINDNKHQGELLEQQNILYQAEMKLELLNKIDDNLSEIYLVINEYQKVADKIPLATNNNYADIQKDIEIKATQEKQKRITNIPKNEENIKISKKYLKENIEGIYSELDGTTELLLDLIKTSSSSATSYIDVSSAYNALNKKIETIRKDISIEKTAQKEYVAELKKINP